MPSEAYQILSGVRQKPKRKWIKVSYGALVKRDAGKLSLEDGFAADGEEDEWGEVTDLGGKFVMPGIIDSHVYVTFPVGFEYADMGNRIEPDGKQKALDTMAKYISENPYRGHGHALCGYPYNGVYRFHEGGACGAFEAAQ